MSMHQDYAENHPAQVEQMRAMLHGLTQYEVDWLRGDRIPGACGAAVIEHLHELGLTDATGCPTASGRRVVDASL